MVLVGLNSGTAAASESAVVIVAAIASARGSIGSGGSIGAFSARPACALPRASSAATRANIACGTWRLLCR